MNSSNFVKLLMLVVCIFVVVPKVSAQELDDVEADMDTAISESDAAQQAEAYGRKTEAEEKSKLHTAKKVAIETATKAEEVKAASTKRLGELEKKTALLITERKAFERKTEKAKVQIQFFEKRVKEAETKLAVEQEARKTAVNDLTNAQNSIANHKKQLATLEANRKKAVAEKVAATRKLASIAHSLPGKKIVMAKNCALHGAMDLKSPQTRFIRKGEKIDLARVGEDGWFHARGARGNGFMHKTCK